MAKVVRVHIKSQMEKYIGKQTKRMDDVMLSMATDIHRQSLVLAPKDTRALIGSGRINRLAEAEYSVEYGNPQVPYARRRHFENKKNPHTLKYLERAGKNVVTKPDKYFRENQ
jgi:hypothetical protein